MGVYCRGTGRAASRDGGGAVSGQATDAGGSTTTGRSAAGLRERRARPKTASTSRAATTSAAVKARWPIAWSAGGVGKIESHMLAKVWKSIASRTLPRVLLKSQVKRTTPAIEPSTKRGRPVDAWSESGWKK